MRSPVLPAQAMHPQSLRESAHIVQTQHSYLQGPAKSGHPLIKFVQGNLKQGRAVYSTPYNFIDKGGSLLMYVKNKTDAKKQHSCCFPAPVRLTFRRYSNNSIPSYHNQRPVATAFFCVVKYHTFTPPGLALVCCRASGTVCISFARTRSKLATSAAVYVMRIFKVVRPFQCSCHPLA